MPAMLDVLHHSTVPLSLLLVVPMLHKLPRQDRWRVKQPGWRRHQGTSSSWWGRGSKPRQELPSPRFFFGGLEVGSCCHSWNLFGSFGFMLPFLGSFGFWVHKPWGVENGIHSKPYFPLSNLGNQVTSTPSFWWDSHDLTFSVLFLSTTPWLKVTNNSYERLQVWRILGVPWRVSGSLASFRPQANRKMERKRPSATQFNFQVAIKMFKNILTPPCSTLILVFFWLSSGKHTLAII